MEESKAGYESNYDLFSLFISKEVKIWPVKKKNLYITMRVPSIRDFYLREDVNAIYHIWDSPIEKMNALIGLSKQTLSSFYELADLILFDLAIYKEFKGLSKEFKSALQFFFPNIDINMQKHIILLDNGISMTKEICDYALYIIKLSCGEKITPPQVFVSEEAKKFYLAQKEAEERIARLKVNGDKAKDGLLKAFLSIEYSFSGFTHDYLLDQTMAQIQWLQKYAAGAVSYDVNAQAFAAGNMKKGKKLDFFIK